MQINEVIDKHTNIVRLLQQEDYNSMTEDRTQC